MSVRKRLRVLWAALFQDWTLYACDCGKAQWVSGEMWSDPGICVECETKAFEVWEAQYHARQRAKEIA